SRGAASLLGRAVAGQSTVIAFDTAFNAIGLLFVIAAPVLVGIKIGLSRYAKARAEKGRAGVAAKPSGDHTLPIKRVPAS
ncbi:MFS transporter, partial [Sinorhizobium meliloti]